MSAAPHTLVLGGGIVGTAAAWDLHRRGHEVVIADRDPAVGGVAGAAVGIDHIEIDAADRSQVAAALRDFDAVVAAVPYNLGVQLAAAAVAAGCHYFDFGGNPTIVKEQLQLGPVAKAGDVAVVPDCGLAPGVANVIAAGMIGEAPQSAVDNVQIRVGCLPQDPIGTLRYQLAFYPGGLINEYAEPCEVISGGKAGIVEPLTRFESVDWPDWGPLEAFATAGGTSTMCRDYEGVVSDLEYKTLRYPGHGHSFAAMRELGLFDTEVRQIGDGHVAPRALLLDLLATNLPQGEPDVVLVRVTVAAGDWTATAEMVDVHDGRFSALARTTAFPATALCDLLTRDEVEFRGAAAMHRAVAAGALLPELAATGLTVTTT